MMQLLTPLSAFFSGDVQSISKGKSHGQKRIMTIYDTTSKRLLRGHAPFLILFGRSLPKYTSWIKNLSWAIKMAQRVKSWEGL